MKVDISNGELIDKITILEIKLERIKDSERLKNVKIEYDILHKLETNISSTGCRRTELKIVNEEIWDCENSIRQLTRDRVYDETFIECAKRIHVLNDVRARIKKIINTETSSEIIEEKSY